jgi:predicted membrane channel-forming protein YqfA (hemolysin III family)
MTFLIFGKSMMYLENGAHRLYMNLAQMTTETTYLFKCSDFNMLAVLLAGTRKPSTCNDVWNALRSSLSFIHR